MRKFILKCRKIKHILIAKRSKLIDIKIYIKDKTEIFMT